MRLAHARPATAALVAGGVLLTAASGAALPSWPAPRRRRGLAAAQQRVVRAVQLPAAPQPVACRPLLTTRPRDPLTPAPRARATTPTASPATSPGRRRRRRPHEFVTTADPSPGAPSPSGTGQRVRGTDSHAESGPAASPRGRPTKSPRPSASPNQDPQVLAQATPAPPTRRARTSHRKARRTRRHHAAPSAPTRRSRRPTATRRRICQDLRQVSLCVEVVPAQATSERGHGGPVDGHRLGDGRDIPDATLTLQASPSGGAPRVQLRLRQRQRHVLLRPGRGGRQFRSAAAPGGAHRARQRVVRHVGEPDGHRRRGSPGDGPVASATVTITAPSPSSGHRASAPASVPVSHAAPRPAPTAVVQRPHENRHQRTADRGRHPAGSAGPATVPGGSGPADRASAEPERPPVRHPADPEPRTPQGPAAAQGTVPLTSSRSPRRCRSAACPASPRLAPLPAVPAVPSAARA